ncbi:hypothetical protein Cme02nite_32310 [Catellatospora methionotrophica]|uniref:Diguanylate cyclase n=1 Tax=Catellatospora methionotrophica TaxID=121620 RepID=A0A8J3PFP1_9ACTN|nr:sensor domain-containing diguanylate cyclase [Catellatospora methionotrophica]GIG14899.1 hypothetical protein Cme02nite_32310 [Catellatospora methionotrophica]
MSADAGARTPPIDGAGGPCRGVRERSWLGYAILWLALLAAYVTANGHDLAQAIVFTVANLASVLAILVGIRLHRPTRRQPWYLLATGQAVYLAANITWYLAPAVEGRPTAFPSPSAELFLLSYLISALALLQLIRARRVGGDWSAMLDALIIAIAFSCVNLVLVVAPQLAETSLTPYGQLLAGIYPFLDMIFLVLAIRLFLGAGGARGALAPLAAWAAALLLADIAYGLGQVRSAGQDGDWSFLGYLASFLFMGVAALHPAMRAVTAEREQPRIAGRVRLIALGLCGILAPGMVVATVSKGHRAIPIILACASALMFVLLMLRVGDLISKIIKAGHAERQRLQQFLEAIPIGVDVRDAETARPVYVNKVAGHLLGYDPAQVIGYDGYPHLFTSGTAEPFPPERLPLVQALRGNVSSVDDIEVEHGAQRRHLRVVAAPIREGERIRYVLTAFTDITAEHRMADELRQLAVVDELTGVNNRRGFLLAARTELALARQARRAGVLLFIDVDGLKAINDRHGHSAGDSALLSAADLLRASIRRHDVLGRIGGDEFCVMLTEASTLGDADQWAGRLRERVARHNESAREHYRLAVTVGATVFDHDTPGTIEDLMARADEAMYQARAQDDGRPGKGPVRINGRARGARPHEPTGP